MPSKNPTTVKLSRKAEAIFREWRRLGPKQILSAGLELFDKLTTDEKLAMTGRIYEEERAISVAERAVRAAQDKSAKRRGSKHQNKGDSEVP